jgi:adenylate cyclase
VQDVHDYVIQHQIALNNGYEMNTHGDSFEIALGSVHSATRFCLAVQLDLLQANWSVEVLRLPSCGEWREGAKLIIIHYYRSEEGQI